MTAWNGEERRALNRKHLGDEADLRRGFRHLRGAVVGLLLVVAATSIGTAAALVEIEHERTDARRQICARIDETRHGIVVVLERFDPAARSPRIQHAVRDFRVPACSPSGGAP